MGGFFGLSVSLACVFARHLGWLSAVPDTKIKGNQGQRKSRWELYSGTAYTQAEPDESASWLVDASHECGMYHNNGNGIDIIPWSEIESYLRTTGQSGYWMAGVLRSISSCFVDEYRKASDPLRPSPLDETVEEKDKQAAVSRQVKSFIRSKS